MLLANLAFCFSTRLSDRLSDLRHSNGLEKTFKVLGKEQWTRSLSISRNNGLVHFHFQLILTMPFTGYGNTFEMFKRHMMKVVDHFFFLIFGQGS